MEYRCIKSQFIYRNNTVKMPYIHIETNIPKNRIPPNFSHKLCHSLAAHLKKPVHYCAATVTSDVEMSFGATNEPTAQVSLTCIDNLGIQENKKHTKFISELMVKELNIPMTRMFIKFINLKSSEIGYNGTTFYGVELDKLT